MVDLWRGFFVRVKIIQYWKELGFDDDSIVYTALENLASWLGAELEI